jgi:Cupin-like domain
MTAPDLDPQRNRSGTLGIDAATFAANYDKRPFAFRHALMDHPLLQWPALVALAKRMPSDKVLHRRGRVPIETDFDRAHELHTNALSLEETLERIEEVQGYVVINTPELDSAFRSLVDPIIAELKDRLATIDPGLYWHASYLFLSAGGSVTPYHMDREMNFLMQIRGSKQVSLWQPEIMTPEEREMLMADWEAPRPAWRESHRESAQVFELRPGDGVHHPFIAPHMVENGAELSVSFAVTFRTRGTDRKTNVYKANHYLRRLGLKPKPPEESLLRDEAKSKAYSALRTLTSVVKNQRAQVRSAMRR